LKALLKLNYLFWKYRGRFLLGTFFIVLSTAFNVYAPIVVGEGVDFLAEALSAAQGKVQTIHYPETLALFRSWFGLSNDIPEARNNEAFTDWVIYISVLIAGLYLFFYLIKGLFLFFQRQTLIVMSRWMEFDIKNSIYAHYQKLDVSFYKVNRTGDLMNRISEDVGRVRMYLGPAVMYTLNLIVLFAMCIGIMYKISPKLTFYTLLPLPFMMIGIFLVSRRINKKTERVQRQQSELSTTVQESMSGIRVLKGFGLEDHFVKHFFKQSQSYKKLQMHLVKTDALFMPVIGMLVGLSTLLTLYIGAREVAAGNITYGVIVQFIFYVNLLTWPFASVGWVTSLVLKGEASMTRILAFLNQNSAIPSGNEVVKNFEELQFKNVSFTYPETDIVALSNLNLSIHKGETIAFIGHTGSGKSSIVQLLMKAYMPTSGSIDVNGINIANLETNEYRNLMGIVPQDVFLFSDTIENNIRFGNANASLEEVIKAAQIADLHENILGFEEKYETLLGERGINLSGGQKQRLSIARAIISNPEILLLDDCLSAVDTQTDEKIMRGLKQVREGKTNIIISHRISSVHHADKVFVLQQGQLAESGTHEELLDKKGLYFELAELQKIHEN
jgi:ATP-binding cassette, subfamily B, multidrug efflux pump